MSSSSPPSGPSGRRRKVVRARSTGDSLPGIKAPSLHQGARLAILPSLIRSFLLDQRGRRCTERTIGNYEAVLDKVVWWMRRFSVPVLDRDALREFFVYVEGAHRLPEGRWGEAGETRDSHTGKRGRSIRERYSAVSAETLLTYHRRLSRFGNWLVEEEIVPSSPMEKVGKPIVRTNDMAFDTYSPEMILAMFDACGKTPGAKKWPSIAKRNRAILALMLDTGLRVSELAGINIGDMDMITRTVTVVGKGNKKRGVFWQEQTQRALWVHLRERNWEECLDEPLFISESGRTPKERMSRGGILALIKRVGRTAGVDRPYAHRFRHTYATMFLNGGGDQLSLMRLLGHEDTTMTNRYVHFAGADLRNKAAQSSPVQQILGRNRRKK